MQLVLCNNRVMAYGENFLSMGGVVINTETGAKYENATITECDSTPSDIGVVGYEYKAGQFVPCAPYGKGDGTVPVLCGDDCKATKDSGIQLSSFCLAERQTYNGNGNGGASRTLTFQHKPLIVFITPLDNSSNTYHCGYLQGTAGISLKRSVSGTPTSAHITLPATFNGNSVTFGGGSIGASENLNYSDIEYEVIAFCIKGV